MKARERYIAKCYRIFFFPLSRMKYSFPSPSLVRARANNSSRVHTYKRPICAPARANSNVLYIKPRSSD